MFEYRAVVNRVVDGDTVQLDVDLGFNVWLHKLTFRIIGVNARELASTGGAEAKLNMQALLPAGAEVIVSSVKSDKYGGRWDARITLPDGSDLADKLVHAGWAAPWDGRGPRPEPAWPRPEQLR